mmetsp:Transcript_33813/g.72112  ORF Transcript_33813/g.72112 Transcript_33813/m.72112 type:complete len:85 (+) Transcript_33813:127-381(+)
MKHAQIQLCKRTHIVSVSRKMSLAVGPGVHQEAMNATARSTAVTDKQIPDSKMQMARPSIQHGKPPTSEARKGSRGDGGNEVFR